MRVYDSDLLRITTLRSLVAAYVIFGTAQGVSSTLSTCPARSINYITQTLPQQCLTSSWTSKPTETSQSIDSTYSDGATTVTAVSKSPTKPTAIPEFGLGHGRAEQGMVDPLRDRLVGQVHGGGLPSDA